ncbi:class I SAM-dependent methyltransferase [Streptomyces lasalocidi]
MAKAASDAARQVTKADRAGWDREYLSGRWDYLVGPAEQARYIELVRHIESNRAQTVLDVGCGSGILRKFLGEPFQGRYVGVDWAHSALVDCTRTRDDLFICADATRLPFRAKFHAVVLSEVLYYLDDPIGVIDYLLNYVQSNGHLLISLYRPPLDRHPKWYELIHMIDAHLRDAANAEHCMVTGGGSRSWVLHILSPKGNE